MAWKDIVSIAKFREAFQQGRTSEVELGMHTIRSHGTKVARSHKLNWFILLLLVFIEVILNIIHPFYRFVGKDMMSDLKYPMKDNTVPVWAVPIYAVLLPIIVFNLFYIWRRSVYDLHHSVLGLLFAVLITGVLTDSIKVAVGRPRPDFFWRCFPDGKDFYNQFGNVVCHGKTHEIREGHKSFPSGHASWSFAGLGYLSLYLAGKLKAFDHKGQIAKLCIVILPLLAASLVAVSRVDDYWHHWQDVFAGAILGLVVATMCYLQFFPPPYHTDELLLTYKHKSSSHFAHILQMISLESMKRYWKRKNYQKLDDTTNYRKHKLRMARLGAQKQQVVKASEAPKVMLKIISPMRLFSKFQNDCLSSNNNKKLLKDKTDCWRKSGAMPMAFGSNNEVVDAVMVLEIYKRLVSSGEVARLLVQYV